MTVTPIGGEFEVCVEALRSRNEMAGAEVLWPLLGRVALHQVILELLRRRPSAPIFLPAYLCDSMVRAARAASSDVRFFDVGRDLCAADPSAISRGSIVVLVRYFGLVDLKAEVARFRSSVPDVLLVADEAHAPWAMDEPTGADLTFTSWRKAYPVVGGAPIVPPICWRQGEIAETFAMTRLAAASIKRIARSRSGEDIDDQAYLSLFQRAEALIDRWPSFDTVLPADHAVMLNDATLRAFQSRRRRNFTFLQQRLVELDLAPLLELRPDATPLFFPVLLPQGQRDRMRRELAAESIFCPVHWPCPVDLSLASTATRALYERELSLVIDFRYDDDDMDRMANALTRALRV